MLKVTKIEGCTLCSNTYVLSCKGDTSCFLVDIGDFSLVKEELLKYNEVKGVLLTHAHFDHIAGINDLFSVFPKVVVYTNEIGKEMLFSDKLNLSKYHERSLIYVGDKIQLVKDGDVLQLFDSEEINVMFTPGHNDSCITYYNRENIFSGDSYIEGTSVVTKLPGGNKFLAEESVQKILALSKDKILYAGHDVDKWKSVF